MLGRIRNAARTAAWASPLLLLAACHVVIQRTPDACDDPADEAAVSVREPRLSREKSLMAMARDLDELERHIDRFGSVTAKNPDVWGQARLTSYRQETEKRLRNELDGFRVSQQGSISRTDVADLLVQLTFSNTGKPDDAAATAKTSAEAAKANADAAKANAEASAKNADAAKAESAKLAAAVTSLEAAAKQLEEAAKKPIVVTTSTADPTINDPKGIVASALAKSTSLEPVRILEQKDHYLSYLNQLRRKNEGDDTSDAPGYSLNLVRIPVSVLPGKRTDRGFGAEAVFTINPVLDHDLLPTTFKELVVNDLLHLLAFPLTKLFEEADLQDVWYDDEFRALLLTDRDEIRQAVKRNEFGTVLMLQGRYGKQAGASTAPPPAPAAANRTMSAEAVRIKGLPSQERLPLVQSLVAKKMNEYSRFLSYSVESKGVRPMPPTQLAEVFGETFVYEIARLAYKLTENQATERGGFVHMPDVQAVLREHLIAAYRFLARPESRPLWDAFCTPELADAVRSHKQDWLYAKRKEFREMVRVQSGTPYIDAFDPNPKLDAEANKLDRLVHFSAASGLAWAILVDSALLNIRLTDDMKRTESVAGVRFARCECPKYFLPEPAAEDRQAFNDYVKKRWPIHVFTLDPATDEQNLADSLTTVRNTQIALSLAFLRGQMSTNAFINATRKVQSTYETIGLNRTQVGFAHGDNTFGWRFYPRFQTPPVRGNIQTFIGGNLLGINNPRDGIRARELEPGPRECVAVVLMPSFVPNATLDASGDWFALANPKRKLLDHTQTLHLSRTVQAIRTDGCGVKDAHKYRDDDHRLLQARAEQLSARLPLQAMRFQVPTINSYGGFELFGTSTTDLAPELYGWYGAPGLKPGEDTTLFLVGDHFSVNHTKILVGNVEVTDYEMLSRQVMKVKVPKGVLTLPADWAGEEVPHAHIHLATPYGVSRELEIPVVCTPAGCATKPETKPATAQPTVPTTAAVTYDKKGAGNGKYELANPRTGDDAVAWLQWPEAAAPAQVWVQLQFQYKNCPLTVALPAAVPAQGNLIPLKKKELDQVANTLFATLKQYGPFADDTNPLAAGLTTAAVKLIPAAKDGTPEVQKAKASVTQLGLTFNCRVPVPEPPKPEPAKAVEPPAADRIPKADEPKPKPEAKPEVPKGKVDVPKGADAPLPPVPTLPPLPVLK